MEWTKVGYLVSQLVGTCFFIDSILVSGALAQSANEPSKVESCASIENLKLMGLPWDSSREMVSDTLLKVFRLHAKEHDSDVWVGELCGREIQIRTGYFSDKVRSVIIEDLDESSTVSERYIRWSALLKATYGLPDSKSDDKFNSRYMLWRSKGEISAVLLMQTVVTDENGVTCRDEFLLSMIFASVVIATSDNPLFNLLNCDEQNNENSRNY